MGRSIGGCVSRRLPSWSRGEMEGLGALLDLEWWTWKMEYEKYAWGVISLLSMFGNLQESLDYDLDMHL
jgi:hypothetical protein